jgi:hypothetical protein
MKPRPTALSNFRPARPLFPFLSARKPRLVKMPKRKSSLPRPWTPMTFKDFTKGWF